MWPLQTQPLPDPATLKDLDPAVAITFLVAFTLLAVTAFFGGTIKDRLSRKPPDPDAAQLVQAVTSPPSSTASTAVDRAAQVSDEYRDYLLQQVQELKARVDELERENRRLREDVERYRYNPPPGWSR